MKKNIAIVTGGDSSEYEISLQSAKFIESSINKQKYNTYTILIKNNEWTYQSSDKESILINKNDFSFVLPSQNKKITIDCAFIIIHGSPGEDGKLQAYFELNSIPYTTSDVLTSALTFNKHFCKKYLKDFDILTADAVMLKKDTKIDVTEIIKKTGLPCFVKPNNGGSSCGISKVDDANNLKNAIQKAFDEENLSHSKTKQVIIEKYIKGIELTCGIIKTKATDESRKELILPITEIASKKDFFDFEAKYDPTLVDEIIPARVSEEIQNECKKLSSKIYDALNCKGIVRIDYILSNNKLYFLEINTIPGMSKNSIIPKQLKAEGISIEKLCDMIIEDAI